MKIPKLSVGFMSLGFPNKIFFKDRFITQPVISWADAGLYKNSDYCDRTQVIFSFSFSFELFISVWIRTPQEITMVCGSDI